MKATKNQQNSGVNQTKSDSDCLICYSDTQLNCSIDSCTSSEEDVKLILKKLLRIPEDTWSSGIPDQGERRLRSSSFKEIRLCGSCRAEIEKAKDLYDQLVKVLKQLKEIQRNFVDLVKKGRGGDKWAYLGGKRRCGRETLADKLREFVNKYYEDKEFVLMRDVLLSLDLESFGTSDSTHENGWSVNEKEESSKTSLFSLENYDEEISSEVYVFSECNSPATDVDPLGDTVDIKMEEVESEEKKEAELETNNYDGQNKIRKECEQESDFHAGSGNSEQGINEEGELGARCKLCHLYCKSQNGLKNHMFRTHPLEPQRLIKKRKRKPPKQPMSRDTERIERKYKCPVENCGKSFVKSYLLRVHFARHSKTPEIQCTLCPEVFYTSGDVLNHVRKVHPELIPPKKKQSHLCDVCSKVFNSSVGLALHKSHAHKIQPPNERPCPEEGCGKMFPRLELLRAHLSKCHGQGPMFKCTQCEKAFHTSKTRWIHEERDHQEGRLKKQFICELCGTGFACREYLYSHKYQKHRPAPHQKPNSVPTLKAPQPEICELCGKTLKNRHNLKSHMLQVHQTEKLKQACHLCPKRFISSRLLKEHLFHTHDIGPEENRRRKPTFKKPMFQCPVTGCRIKCYGDESAEKHRIEFHGEDGNKQGKYTCKFCSKSFFIRSKFNHHEMRHENKDTRPFICDICQKGFSTPGNLHFHRTHTHKVINEDKRRTRHKASSSVNPQANENN